jgi:putrescine importer
MSTTPTTPAGTELKLRRVLGLWDLVFYGLIVIQLTAPMPVFGVMSQRAQGHAVTTVLFAMVAMLFTAVSYGQMARAYPSAGSAFTYVGREIHPALGYITGWGMAMDYMVNPILCTVWCSKAAGNMLPEVPFPVWAIFFALLFTGMNLFGIRTSARINEGMAAGMGIVIAIFLIMAARYVLRTPHDGMAFFTRPFYDVKTFSLPAVLSGTSLAVLTYIGFDGISTLSEEAENPRRNILLATVLVCLLTGIMASVEVYSAQLVWPGSQPFPDVDTAYVHVAGRAGGPWLFGLINFTLLVATVGSGMGSQLGAARLLYGMGRGNAIPRSFFGALEPKRRIPRNNVLFVGSLALVGSQFISFERCAELVNFGALLAFMGVNAAAFTRYYLREPQKRWTSFFPPLLGFTICLLLWLNLSRPAKVAGATWVFVGIAYGAFRTRGFRAELVQFDVPEE